MFLTVGIYYTPSGKAILNNGVAPNVEVPPPNSQSALLDGQDLAPDPAPGQLPSPKDLLVQKAVQILENGESADKVRGIAPATQHAQQLYQLPRPS